MYIIKNKIYIKYVTFLIYNIANKKNKRYILLLLLFFSLIFTSSANPNQKTEGEIYTSATHLWSEYITQYPKISFIVFCCSLFFLKKGINKLRQIKNNFFYRKTLKKIEKQEDNKIIESFNKLNDIYIKTNSDNVSQRDKLDIK